MNALNRFLILNRKNFKFTRAVDAGRGHGWALNNRQELFSV